MKQFFKILDKTKMFWLIFWTEQTGLKKINRDQIAKKIENPGEFLIQYHLGGRASVMLMVCSVWLMS
jgi:hypothetical protein